MLNFTLAVAAGKLKGGDGAGGGASAAKGLYVHGCRRLRPPGERAVVHVSNGARLAVACANEIVGSEIVGYAAIIYVNGRCTNTSACILGSTTTSTTRFDIKKHLMLLKTVGHPRSKRGRHPR